MFRFYSVVPNNLKSQSFNNIISQIHLIFCCRFILRFCGFKSYVYLQNTILVSRLVLFVVNESFLFWKFLCKYIHYINLTFYIFCNFTTKITIILNLLKLLCINSYIYQFILIWCMTIFLTFFYFILFFMIFSV